MGSASVVNVVFGLIRTKVSAALLGPAGIGIIGLLQSIMNVATTLVGFGMGRAGTRQIAAAATNNETLRLARRALSLVTSVTALLGGVVFFLCRSEFAARIADDPHLAPALGWLGLGVALTVASASQGAQLQGLRRIDELARLQILSAIVSTLLGVAALLTWQEDGIVPFLLSAPLASFLLGHWYVSRLKLPATKHSNLQLLVQQWRDLARIGAASMASSLVASISVLVTRSIVQHQLGAGELGQYQAAWAISMTYLGLVLSAMTTDFYPRLSAVIDDHREATRLINEQIEVALLLGGPLLIGMMALAPLTVELLYSEEFAVAAGILRWQVLGDVLKITSWPLAVALLASGASRAMVTAELCAALTFVLAVWTGLPYLGIEATGPAFLAMYTVHLPVTLLLVRKRLRFTCSAASKQQGSVVAVTAMLVKLLAIQSELAAALLGCSAAAVLGFYSIERLSKMSGLRSPVRMLVGRIHKRVNRRHRD